MASTIVGYFDDYTTARRAEQDLLNSGLSSQHVQLVAQNGDVKTTENWWERFKSAFGATGDEERTYYEEAVRRGALLSVRVENEAQVDQIVAIIERHNPNDLDARHAEWSGSATTGTATSRTATAADATLRANAKSESIPLAQEELQVGKRAVQRGALRVHTYVTEKPVQEQVSLREEQAFVERTPVNRAATAGDATFKERTIEVQELGEEAVVNKQARVVEEVRVGKEQTQRSETVRDTVRKQEVEVQRVEGKDVKRTGASTTTTTTPVDQRPHR